ncbi:MAG: hypothetical protein H6719_15505 [Sandaracinaceae bacterium]|nr:hypothetical protein [Sandaracinaceae bacterium]
MAEAVLARLDPETRRAHHLALAETVERSGPSDAMEGFLLRHLEAGGEPQRAAVQARLAADRAASVFALERAASLYRTALRLGRFPPDESASLRASLGDALGRCGHGPDAAEAYLAVAESTEGSARLDAQRRAAQHLLGCGQVGRGVGVLRTVAKDIGLRFPASELEGTASLIWQRMKIASLGDRWVERDERDVDPEVLRRIDVFHAIGFGLSTVGLVRGEDLTARGLYLAMRTGERKRLARAMLLESQYQACATERGRRRARWLVAEGARIAEDTKDAHLAGLVAATRHFNAFLEGRFRECLDLRASTEELLREGRGEQWHRNWVRLADLFARVHFVGELGAERARIDEYLKDAARRDDRLFETSMRAAAAVRWLASDEPGVLLELIDEPTWVVTGVARSTLREHGTWPQIYDLWARAQHALYTDDAGALARVEEGFVAAERSLLMRAVQVMRIRARWIHGLVALALARHGGGRRATALAGAIAKKQEREGTGYAAAIAGLLRSGIASAAGDRRAARSALSEALPLARRAELRLAASAMEWRLGQWTPGEEGASLGAAGARRLEAEGVVDVERMARLLVPT